MKTVYFEDFRLFLLEQYHEIAALDPEFQSVEWFLLRYLKKIEKNTLSPADPAGVENSMRGFIRFYVDMIDEHSALGIRCRTIYNRYRKTLLDQQQG